MSTIVFTDYDDVYSHTTFTDDTLLFLEGNDRLDMFEGTVTASMGAGDDIVVVRGGGTEAYGEAGNDRFELYFGGSVFGGSGNDTFNMRGVGGIIAGGGAGDDRFNLSVGGATLHLFADIGDDIFDGNGFSASGEIYGSAGSNRFTGFNGSILLYGQTGNDVYRFDSTSTATFVENAGEGIDTVQLYRGHTYTLPANVENVVIGTYAGSTATAAAVNGNALNNKMVGSGNAESFYGNDGNDALYAKSGDDYINGGNGNDLVDGGAGNDTLIGGVGDDRLIGRTGADAMAGGTGNDIYYVDDAGDTVSEGAASDTDTIRSTVNYTLSANVENGFVQGSGPVELTGNSLNNRLSGGSGDDIFHGNNGDDLLLGYGGADHIYAGSGADHLSGGAGFDILFGDAGNDIIDGGDFGDGLTGGDGADRLTGGAGGDTFYYFGPSDANGDQILDFRSAAGAGTDDDLLDLLPMDAIPATVADDAFAYVSSFSGVAGQLTIALTSSNPDGSIDVRASGDLDGDSVADFSIDIHCLTGNLFLDDILL